MLRARVIGLRCIVLIRREWRRGRGWNCSKKMGLDFLPITRPGEVDLEGEKPYDAQMEKRSGRDPIE